MKIGDIVYGYTLLIPEKEVQIHEFKVLRQHDENSTFEEDWFVDVVEIGKSEEESWLKETLYLTKEEAKIAADNKMLRYKAGLVYQDTVTDEMEMIVLVYRVLKVEAGWILHVVLECDPTFGAETRYEEEICFSEKEAKIRGYESLITSAEDCLEKLRGECDKDNKVYEVNFFADNGVQVLNNIRIGGASFRKVLSAGLRNTIEAYCTPDSIEDGIRELAMSREEEYYGNKVREIVIRRIDQAEDKNS